MKTTRRSFLASAAAGLVPFAGFPSVVSRRSPNATLSHACVGTGNMALADLNGLRSHPRIHITALCDVDANYLARAQKLCPDARVYRNAHEMFEKEGNRIDSVNVSTPDHSHAGYILDALARGLNVYGQKPLCHDIADCRKIEKLAAEKKVTFPEWVVDNRIRDIVREKFDGDMNKLNAMLTQIKTPLSEWRNMIRDDMIVTSMRQQFVEKNIVPSPADMQREYKENKARYRAESKTSVRVILLKPADAGDKKAKSVSARGKELLDKLEKGEDFAALAKSFSADSHAKDGGLWKDVDPQKSFRPEIAKAIASLKVGEFSTLIDLDGWGFIVRKESETAAKDLSFAEAYDRIERNLKREAGQAEYRAWVKRLREAAFVRVFPFPDGK